MIPIELCTNHHIYLRARKYPLKYWLCIIADAFAKVCDPQTVDRLFDASVTEAKKKAIKLPIGLMDIGLHDIRRTVGSYQAITGSSLPVIGKSLGHKSQQATQIYSRLHLDPVRESMERATDSIFTAGRKDVFTK